MKTKKTLLFLSVTLFLLTACSPVKKLNRMQRKYPYLFTKKTDTVKVKDTIKVTVPGVKIDTSSPLFKIFQPHGLNIDKERLHLNIKGDTITKRIFITGKVDTVYKTIYYEKKVPVKKYIVKKAPFDWRRLWWILAFVSAIIIAKFVINQFSNNN